MGTHAIITIVYNQKKINLYIQRDGYPGGAGANLACDLKEILTALSKNPVNGIKNIKNLSYNEQMTNMKKMVEQMVKFQMGQTDANPGENLFPRAEETEIVVEEMKKEEEKIVYPDNILMIFKEHLENMKIVNNDDPPTRREIKLLKKYSDTSVCCGHLFDWYVLLRNCQGELITTLQSGYILSHPYDREEHVYVVDLDTDQFYHNGNLVSSVTKLSPDWYIEYEKKMIEHENILESDVKMSE